MKGRDDGCNQRRPEDDDADDREHRGIHAECNHHLPPSIDIEKARKPERNEDSNDAACRAQDRAFDDELAHEAGRPAPTAMRVAISRVRTVARARSMPATFAAAITSTRSATPKSIPMNWSIDFWIVVGRVRTGSAHALTIFVLRSSVAHAAR